MPRLSRPLLLMACIALLACGQRPDPAAAPAESSAPAAAPPCLPAMNWQAAGRGRFSVTDHADDSRYEVRLTVAVAGKTYSEAVHLPPDRAAAIVNAIGEVPAQTQVCADRWFIQDLPEERGGSLVIGELRDGRLALSVRDYPGGDEEPMRIAWGREEPVWVDASGRQSALSELAQAAGAVAAEGDARTLACEAGQPGSAHFLTLRLGAGDRLEALGYTTATAGGHCSVDAARGDGDTAWADTPEATTVTWSDGEPGAPGDSAVSSLRITREAGGYALDMARMKLGSFCGQSAEIALAIGLTPGQARCAVELRGAGPENQ